MRETRVVAQAPTDRPFVAPETLERERGAPFRLRLGANESVFGPSPAVAEAFRRSADHLALYGDPECYDLRQALSKTCSHPFEGITVASGIDELLLLVCRAYVEPGQAVVTTAGSYATFEYAAYASGAEIVRVPYSEFSTDLPKLAAAANEHQAAIVYLANPDNPSGAFFAAERIQQFRELLPNSTLLILDEAYSEFVSATELVKVSPDDDSVVRLRTFSKAHGLAGLRVGYLLGTPRHRVSLDKVRPHFGVSGPAQVAALASLDDLAHVRSVVAATSFGRLELMTIAGHLGLVSLPTRTNFGMFDLGSAERANDLLMRLRREGVFVRKPAVPPLDRFIRITVGTTSDLVLLEPVLQKVLREMPEA